MRAVVALAGAGLFLLSLSEGQAADIHLRSSMRARFLYSSLDRSSRSSTTAAALRLNRVCGQAFFRFRVKQYGGAFDGAVFRE
jgi:hypothetical protein